MLEDEIPEAVVEKRKGIPIVWLLPIIALGIAGWLFYQTLVDAPLEIRIQFPTADGIEPDKTEVRFRGIPLGVVRRIDVKSDLQSVIATIDIDRRAERGLVGGTKFWMVLPRASLAGISGLDTLISGSYINMALATETNNPPKRDFIALDEPPPLAHSVPGLHIALLAEELGSLFVDAPIIYKDFTIGSVQAYQLRDDGLGVSIDVYIQPEFSYLVNSSTRFFNSSGVSFSGDISGFELKIDSFASLLVGGISLHNDKSISDTMSSKNGDEFKLYDNFDAAKAGLPIELRLNSSEYVVAGQTKIKYKGFVVGRIEAVTLDSDLITTVATAMMVPQAGPYLNTGAKFWLVKPRLSLSGITGLETLVTGSYLEIDIGKGEPSRMFNVLMEPPILGYDIPGLHLKLRTQTLGSLGRGAEIFFRKIPVGFVQGYRLLDDHQEIEVDLFIEPKYAHLVSDKTRFWNASGIDIRGSLQGVKIRTESISSIIRGGIAFSNDTDAHTVKPARNGDVFNLYPSRIEAQQKGIRIQLKFATGDGLFVGMALKHMGIVVGEVKTVRLNEHLSSVIVSAVLDNSAKPLAVAGSQFWLVKPELSLTKSANLETLVKGQYIAVKRGNGKRVTQFEGLNLKPTIEKKQRGLNIVLINRKLGSLKPGVKMFYRGVPVGEVTGYSLAETADNVRIYANINDAYRELVRENTVFWNISGIDLSVGLFSGAKLETDSLESILGGGVSFATPDTSPLEPAAKTNSVFALKDKAQDEWHKWNTKISLKTKVKDSAVDTIN
jgi:paraquat-inducible protein B